MKVEKWKMENNMTAQNSRNEMNKFNFDGIYEEYENNCWHDNGQLKISSNISNNNIIIKEYESIRNALKEYGLEAGIISNGNHGLDLLDIYKERIDFSLDYKSWNKTPVMFVYDSPADHLDTDKEKFIYACDEKKYTSEQLRAHQDEEMEIDTKYYLSTHLWREADINENIYEKIKIDGKVPSYAFFDKKSYGEFIVSLMINFELSNVYTTNLFRYQVTSNEKMYYNLGQMLDVVKNNKNKNDFVYQVFKNIFVEEVKQFKPKAIIATASVYDYLDKHKTELQNGKEEIRLIKIIHPATRITSENRRCINMCGLAKELYSAGVIEKNQAEKIVMAYLE